MICKRFLVSGRVQGVFYRDSTRRQAQAQGISGWVRNLFDGRVEVLACERFTTAYPAHPEAARLARAAS